MNDGFLRVAVATPAIQIANCSYTIEKILQIVNDLPPDTAVAAFPELVVTGYTCGDLFLQPTLLRDAERAVARFLRETAARETVFVLGVPVAQGPALYDSAVVCQRGRLLGIVPKSFIPAYSEFYEARHFAAAPEQNAVLSYAGQRDVPFGKKLLFCCEDWPDFCLGVEICEDLWVADQPSIALAKAGATVVVNLSASDEAIGKDTYRRDLVRMQSARLCCAYLYADAGEGESTADLVFSGHDLIGENGLLLAESPRFSPGFIAAEVDLARLQYERRRLNTFVREGAFQRVPFSFARKPLQLTRTFPAFPFVPQETSEHDKRCEDILTIQAAGLAHRLQHTGAQAVIGLSGGLDSALALLVTARAYDRLGRSRRDITAVTMPCFGTTGRTLQNACRLAQEVGAALHKVDITASVEQHLRDIAHEGALDVTFENAQARERTQVLMDMANQRGALVIGTGDLSELALGFATYNGDHMSMYGVNASVPKTLVRHLVAYEGARCGGELLAVLGDILATPVSPELLPPKDGEIAQQTEQLIGPYELHDFFLYYLLRFGYEPRKIWRIACLSFAGKFSKEDIKRYLTLFLKRFFAQQFKRNCLPDGSRIGSVALSPRGDLRLPSDATAAAWLADLESCGE